MANALPEVKSKREPKRAVESHKVPHGLGPIVPVAQIWTYPFLTLIARQLGVSETIPNQEVRG